MDCAVIPLKEKLSLVQTVDFFYPLVDDPKVMGKIALANVLSDVYAVGVIDIDHLKVLISTSTEFSENERGIIFTKMMEGFLESARLAKCSLEISNIVINPWCLLGGIATSVSENEEIIMPYNARSGDFLVLTKPLGTQLATNAYIWKLDGHDNHKRLLQTFKDEDIERTYNIAVSSMTYLNRNAALLMHKYNANACTDVTGFGLLGHAKNLAEFQKACLLFKINKLPIMRNVLEFGKILNMDTKLKTGKAVETSGGLLISMPAKNANKFCEEFKEATAGMQNAWIVGEVIESKLRDAVLNEDPEFVEVDLG